MKRLFFFTLFMVTLSFAVVAMAKHFWRGETMSVGKACQRWGEMKLDATGFRNGNEEVRSKMACSILRNQNQFLGKDRSEIRKILGDYDGFYFSDMFPAY